MASGNVVHNGVFMGFVSNAHDIPKEVFSIIKSKLDEEYTAAENKIKETPWYRFSDRLALSRKIAFLKTAKQLFFSGYTVPLKFFYILQQLENLPGYRDYQGSIIFPGEAVGEIPVTLAIVVGRAFLNLRQGVMSSYEREMKLLEQLVSYRYSRGSKIDAQREVQVKALMDQIMEILSMPLVTSSDREKITVARRFLNSKIVEILSKIPRTMQNKAGEVNATEPVSHLRRILEEEYQEIEKENPSEIKLLKDWDEVEASGDISAQDLAPLRIRVSTILEKPLDIRKLSRRNLADEIKETASQIDVPRNQFRRRSIEATTVLVSTAPTLNQQFIAALKLYEETEKNRGFSFSLFGKTYRFGFVKTNPKREAQIQGLKEAANIVDPVKPLLKAQTILEQIKAESKGKNSLLGDTLENYITRYQAYFSAPFLKKPDGTSRAETDLELFKGALIIFENIIFRREEDVPDPEKPTLKQLFGEENWKQILSLIEKFCSRKSAQRDAGSNVVIDVKEEPYATIDRLLTAHGASSVRQTFRDLMVSAKISAANQVDFHPSPLAASRGDTGTSLSASTSAPNRPSPTTH